MSNQNDNRTGLRIKDFNYRSPGFYFVTICTENKKKYFGEIFDYSLKYSALGDIAMEKWLEIPHHFPHIHLDEFVIMPNHIHGILRITPIASDTEDVACNVPTTNSMSSIAPKSGSLSVIVRSYKSVCTKSIREKFPSTDFRWQSRFYEHIIRDDMSLLRIRQYIQDNPKNWIKDELHI